MAKKTMTVETPIDQRETFVSIQRNFADSDFAAGAKLRALYELQLTDIQIDKIMQLRGELPLEVEQLESEIADLEAKVARANEQLEEAKAKIADSKNEIAEYDASAAKYKEQVEHVSNSREYASLSKEIENLDLLRQISEKKISEAKEFIESKNGEIENLQARLQVRNDDLGEKQKELATIVESTAKDEEKLRASREKLTARVDARTLSAYDRIRNSNKNHLAVVTVYNDNACGGCFSTIPPQRLIDIASNKKMIVCEYCGRILVNPNFE